MARFPAIRQGRGFFPTNQAGRDATNAVPAGAEVMISVQTARNIRAFHLFWKLCEVIADNHPHIDNKEHAKRCLLRATGRFHLWFDAEGKMHEELDSIAWENMPDEDFREFFRDAVRVIGSWLECLPSEIAQEVEEMISPSIAPEQAAERERVA
jgi:hypothetical protein